MLLLSVLHSYEQENHFHLHWPLDRASQVALVVKNLPANAGDIKVTGLIPGLGRSLEKGMATHSSILTWRIPWMEEPGGLQSRESQSWSQLRWLSTHIHTSRQAYAHTCSLHSPWKQVCAESLRGREEDRLQGVCALHSTSSKAALFLIYSHRAFW